ncbi:hypothetical protein SprV_0200682200 [Sparganum proliferum]
MSNPLSEKDRLHKAYIDRRTDANKVTSFRRRCLVQQQLWEMQEAWMDHMVDEVQGYADFNETNNSFTLIKTTYGPAVRGTAQITSPDGTALPKEKSEILKCGIERFRSVLNRPSTISDAATDRLPQLETNIDLDLPHSIPETIRAVHQIFRGNAPGSDDILAEFYTYGSPRLVDKLASLFRGLWC